MFGLSVLKKQLPLILLIIIIIFSILVYTSIHNIKFDQGDNAKLTKVVTVEAFTLNY
jgi:hypothetical protein